MKMDTSSVSTFVKTYVEDVGGVILSGFGLPIIKEFV